MTLYYIVYATHTITMLLFILFRPIASYILRTQQYKSNFQVGLYVWLAHFSHSLTELICGLFAFCAVVAAFLHHSLYSCLTIYILFVLTRNAILLCTYRKYYTDMAPKAFQSCISLNCMPSIQIYILYCNKYLEVRL